MPFTRINLRNKKTTLDSLIKQLKRGKKILLSDGDTLIAQLLPAPEFGGPRIPGLHEGAITFISDDFDDELPDEFWFGDDEDALPEESQRG